MPVGFPLSFVAPEPLQWKGSKQPGPEALNQIISKRGHLPRPDPLDRNSSGALQHFRFDSP